MSERGYCECGCGEAVRLPKHRYIHNHHRLKSPVPYVVDENGCWLWQRALVPDGYGSMGIGAGRVDRAHKVYYERRFGPVPDGCELHHVCDVRRCVNPDHLTPITRRAHRRLRRDNKLTFQDAEAIRASSELGPVLAKRYGVTDTAVNQIRRGETWRP